jgi:hypothetical protein
MSEEVQTGRLVPYLVEMFRYQAWVSMGKVASPATGKVEREMPVARAMIDMLSELETRTEGNRSPEETRMLQGALTDLRLNYLDEMKRPQPGTASPEPAEGAASAEAGGGASDEADTAAGNADEATEAGTDGASPDKESETTETP